MDSRTFVRSVAVVCAIAGAGMAVSQGAGNFKKRQKALKAGVAGPEAMKVSGIFLYSPPSSVNLD